MEVQNNLVPPVVPEMQEVQSDQMTDKALVKRLWLWTILSVVFLLIVGGCVWGYYQLQFDIFGKKTDVFAEEISFNGKEIPDLDSLKNHLRRFKNLKKADLGSFPVEVEQSFALRQAFPDTELVYQTVVLIENETYRTDITSLNVSEHGITDFRTFSRKLEYLPELKTVIFGDITIPNTEKEKLESAFPEVSFEVIETYDVYGKQVMVNAESLDLRDVQLDASILDQIALFPNLVSVDLHGQKLTDEERIALITTFPEISFGWTVFYDGEEYDSSIKELDLSGKRMTEDDLPELKSVIAQFSDLEIVNMCNCGLGNETLANFRQEIRTAKVVWRVYLGSRWSLRTDAIAFSVLIIHYDYPRMYSNNLHVLKYCPELLALDLGHQAISDISGICEWLPELRLLILADNQIWDISPLKNLKHLHYLELFLNRISDLSPLAELRELVDVNISYNPIGDITPLLNSPMMQRVWMESTYCGWNSVSLLKETYPDAKIVLIGSGSVDQGWRWGNARYEQMMDMWKNNYYGDEFQKYDDLAVELGLR